MVLVLLVEWDACILDMVVLLVSQYRMFGNTCYVFQKMDYIKRYPHSQSKTNVSRCDGNLRRSSRGSVPVDSTVLVLSLRCAFRYVFIDIQTSSYSVWYSWAWVS